MTDKDFTMERFLFNLNTLGELGEEICSPKDFNNVIKSALYMVMGSFLTSKGIIFKYDSRKKIFFPAVSKGIDDAGEITLRFTDEAMRAFVQHNRPLDIKGSSPMLSHLVPARAGLAKFGARIMVFLIVGDELVGALSINDKFSGEGYTDYDFQLLSVMSQYLSFSLHNHSLLIKLTHKYNENEALYEKNMKLDPRGGYSPLSALVSRAFNLSFALPLTIVSAPLFLIISVMIKLLDGGAVMYKGIRLGMNKRPFTIYKFRTLIPDAELEIGAELLSRKHQVVTKSGKFLRDTRLDELPQLFNIIKGDMDFLGPRPERQAIYEKYCKDIQGYDKRFLVRPGIVGYSQLFTPHGTPKKIRALIDNYFLLKKRRLSWEMYLVLKTVITLNVVIASKTAAYIWNGFIKRKILKQYHREKRESERIRVSEGKAFVGRQAKDEDYVFSTCAELKDINEEAFLLYTDDKITQAFDVFWLEIDHARAQCKRRVKRKTAWCHGDVYRELQLNDNFYRYSYIIKYIPHSPLNAYIIDKYFLRKSIMRH